MELTELFKMGARLIEGNSDEATTGLDIDQIANALSGMFATAEGTLDLSPIMKGLSQSGLGDIVSSWLGNGENLPISAEQIASLLGDENIVQFAQRLGISVSSAQNALRDALPQVVDRATGGGDSIVDEMLGQVGGAQGAMELLGKMFR